MYKYKLIENHIICENMNVFFIINNDSYKNINLKKQNIKYINTNL